MAEGQEVAEGYEVAVRDFSEGEFLAEVQRYDCLYNKFSRDFKDKYKKINCWKKVGEVFGMTAPEAETKFKNLRSSYTRFLRRMKNIPSGSGADALRNQASEFAAFEWLLPYISNRRTTTNLTASNFNNIPISSPPVSLSPSNNSFNKTSDEESQSRVDDGEAIYLQSTDKKEENISDGQSDIEMDGHSARRVDNDSTIVINDDGNGKEVEHTDFKKKRPWNSLNKKSSKIDIDKILINTAKSIGEHLKQSKDVKSNENLVDDDEDSLFFRSLVRRFKRLPNKTRSYVRLQIEQLFFQAEYNCGPNADPQATHGNFNTGFPNYASYIQPGPYQGFTGSFQPSEISHPNAEFHAESQGHTSTQFS